MGNLNSLSEANLLFFSRFVFVRIQQVVGSEVGGPVTMRQAVEAQVLNPHCELGEDGQLVITIYLIIVPLYSSV